jgi:hypothetical protein
MNLYINLICKNNGETNMKKTTKQIFGGLMVLAIIGTIGAVVVSAHPFSSELTDEQRDELEELRESLIGEDTTQEEIREAMNGQLESYGIDILTKDEMLDKQINTTRQRLEILERKKTLREEGYEWEEIDEIIQEEFDIEYPLFEEKHQRYRRGFKRGSCIGPGNFIPNE